MGYYHIARFSRGKGIAFNGANLSVDLDAIGPEDHIKDDISFLSAITHDSYIYISGGGTFLINGRYLIVVKRDATAHVNPGHLSLFTGRANGPDEWEQPWFVVRELFEELVLFSEGKMLYPVCPEFQPIIDATYQNEKRPLKGPLLNLSHIPLATGTIKVARGARTISETPAFFHVNSRNDINLLYLFGVDVDLDKIVVTDGEYLGGNKRVILALDIKTMMLTELTGSPLVRKKQQDASSYPLTEHLYAMLTRLSAHNEGDKKDIVIK